MMKIIRRDEVDSSKGCLYYTLWGCCCHFISGTSAYTRLQW